LRDYARGRGVAFIGDVPIFVALDSADTWRWREAFRIDAQGRAIAVAGVPPDYFSEKGQLWGNPLYDWAYLAKTGYAWWIKRLRLAFELCDLVRIDHFRGFDTYWKIPADSVVYTGPHDNDTTKGWLMGLHPEEFALVADYFGLNSPDSAWPILRAAFASVARLAVVPIQDLLDLPSTARLNRPGSTDGNWRWRFTREDLALLRRSRLETLVHWHRLFDRTGDTRQRDYSAPPADPASLHGTPCAPSVPEAVTS